MWLSHITNGRGEAHSSFMVTPKSIDHCGLWPEKWPSFPVRGFLRSRVSWDLCLLRVVREVGEEDTPEDVRFANSSSSVVLGQATSVTWKLVYSSSQSLPSLLNEDLPSHLCLGFSPLGDCDIPWKWKATGLVCSGGTWREDQHSHLDWKPLETHRGAAVEEIERTLSVLPCPPHQL